MFDLKGNGTDFIDHVTIRRIRDMPRGCVVEFYGKKNEDVYVATEKAASIAGRLSEYLQIHRLVYLGRGKGFENVPR